ncbi:hypothetical protein QUF58_00705 [Anaerolineales bacterium HSG24]|nr:hypothetical protein [Anaerolineales bacterium HSG24]
MLQITIEPTVETKLEQFAQLVDQSVEEIINQALSRYLDYLSDRKLDTEISAYEKLHPQLKQKYLGHYVAIHQGQLIDTDTDCGNLFLRVEKKYGDVTILIRQVKETPDEIYNFHGVRMERAE